MNYRAMTKISALLWGILCLLVVICACGKQDDLLEEKFIRQLKSPGDVSEVSLQEIANFDWDSMYYFMPYTDKETAEKAIGFSSEIFRTICPAVIAYMHYLSDTGKWYVRYRACQKI